jgi:hypothetical protein
MPKGWLLIKVTVHDAVGGRLTGGAAVTEF